MKPNPFPFLVARPGCRLRLLCLPFAGGSAFTYREWARLLPSSIEVRAFELPGHGVRIREPARVSIDELVSHVGAEVAALLDRPLAIFGHSMGARIGFEVARALERRGAPPVHLFVSASAAPHLAPAAILESPPESPPTLEWLATMLRRLGATPPEVLENRELLDLLLPALHADLALITTYRAPREARVSCPTTAFAGSEDSDVPLAAALGWRDHSGGAFRAIEVAGGHFFVTSAREALLGHIAETLAPEL